MISSMILLRVSAVQCLLLTSHQTPRSPAFLHLFSRSPLSEASFRSSRRTRTSRTRLLFSEFDKFIQPYGVTLENGTSSLHDENHTELLDALLPRAYSKQDTITNRARVYESFQRTRLGEQLRLNRLSRQGGKQPDGNRYIDNAHMLEMFQRARLAEQLRFEKNNKPSSWEQKEQVTGLSSSYLVTQQTKLVKNASAPMKMHLEQLHQLVHVATRPSSPMISIELVNKNTTSHNNTTIANKSLIDFLANTHLPLPPREDAPLLSLILAPMAHVVTSLFLISASLFYVVMAALDVLCNDDMTKSCLIQAGRVWTSCWSHLFSSTTGENGHNAFQKITEVGKTSIFALWYVAKCIVIRAQHSKYANDCMDAGTGSLRYAVYAIRSLDVLWRTVIDRYWRRKNRNNVTMDSKLKAKKAKLRLVPTWKRKFHLYRLQSSIRNGISKRIHKQQYLQLEQQRLRLEREYQEKLCSLNQDRIALERDRRAVRDARCQVDEERKRLLCESVNVLAWYFAAKAESSSDAVEDSRPKSDGWGLGRWWKAWN
ncbi:hypothetical protein HJC23_001403 [Cyclotella cryptica]|uniref:Uncharacterized protein n=1 Tax=Cyclotella cryptica TaxID=29204 RepID=A0ABD3P8Q3_9STRA